jgi:MoaA/NifB/PqqE/SkfB family radical SAM enzyme
MRVRYEFPNVKLLRKLILEVENRDSRLFTHTSGRLSFVFKRIFRLLFDVYNQIGPVGTSDGANVYSLYIPPVPSPMHSREVRNLMNRWLHGVRRPMAVTIGVTEKCQCSCEHCSAVGGSRQAPVLTLDEIRRVVRESVDYSATDVTFTGGEPLLRGDLEEMVASVPREKAVSLVFTNGIGLTPERTRSLKDAGLWAVQISLDSPDPEEHDRRRGWAGCFRAVEDGIKAAREAGLFVGLSTYADNDFVRNSRFEKMALIGESWGVHELTVFDVIPTGRLLGREDVQLTPENRRVLLQKAAELKRKYHARMHVITQSWTNCKSGFARFIGCLAGHFQFHVTSRGDFRPCDFNPFILGNVREESVPDLWEKLISHPAFRKHSHRCRMQDPAFRKKYLSGLEKGVVR